MLGREAGRLPPTPATKVGGGLGAWTNLTSSVNSVKRSAQTGQTGCK